MRCFFVMAVSLMLLVAVVPAQELVDDTATVAEVNGVKITVGDVKNEIGRLSLDVQQQILDPG